MSTPYEIGTSPDRNYVFVRAIRQPITLDLALEFIREVTRLGERLEIYSCLLDMRGTTSISGVLGKYRFAYGEGQAAGLSPRWKLAILKDYEDDTPDFMTTVMRNAGYRLEIFTHESNAVSWLVDVAIRERPAEP